MPQANSANFKRTTDPLWVPVDVSATRFEVPAGYFATGGKGKGATSFYVVNPNRFWVRLRGSGLWVNGVPQGNFVPVDDNPGGNNGWLFGPGFQGSFATQFPRYMSCLAVERQGIVPAINANNPAYCEISYGNGS